MSDKERIAQLENENAALRSRLRAAGLLPPPCDLPSDPEIDRLIALVETAHPKLKARDQSEHRRAFAAALHYLSFARRADKLNTTYAVVSFVDAANEWLRRFQLGGTNSRAFYAAAIASGIAYAAPGNFPHDLELGLGLSEGTHAVAGWRNILAVGKLPPPSELKRRTMPQTQQALIRPGADHGFVPYR